MDEDNKKIPDGTEGNDWIDQLLQEVKNENEGEASPKAPSQPLHPSAPPVQRAAPPQKELEPAPEEEEPPRRRRPKRIRVKRKGKLFSLLYLAVALAACSFAAVFCLNAVRDVLAISKPNQAITVTIPSGSDAKAVGNLLKEDGIIQYPFVFELVAKYENYVTFQAGTHVLNSNMDYMTLMKSMQKPKKSRETVRVTIPEGLPAAKIAKILEENGVCDASDFLSALENTDFRFSYESEIPDDSRIYRRLEGYLFPDTYEFYKNDTALNVTEGVEDQPIVNPYFTRRKKPKLSTDQYVEGILAGNITTLSQAITLIESNNPAHYAQAQEIIERCLPHAGKSVRIGITGVPGAGKSTFIEAVGNMVTSLRHKLAVLAIDPSSERSGGSILGDKTRMESISGNPDVFIRPSPSAGSLGGVARKTRETIVLCEAAGFDVIFIETVGVGQSETAVHSMVDMFMLLQISGAGDELQGIKRGIMEMADIMVITKADGENIHKAELAKTQFQGALRLFPLPESGWRPKVYTCSAVAGTGLEEVWKGVEEFLDHIEANGYFRHNRNRQNKYWMYESINEVLRNSFYHDPAVESRIAEYEQRVLDDKISSFIAAKELLDIYFKDLK